jgi:hypothetical protein
MALHLLTTKLICLSPARRKFKVDILRYFRDGLLEPGDIDGLWSNLDAEVLCEAVGKNEAGVESYFHTLGLNYRRWKQDPYNDHLAVDLVEEAFGSDYDSNPPIPELVDNETLWEEKKEKEKKESDMRLLLGRCADAMEKNNRYFKLHLLKMEILISKIEKLTYEAESVESVLIGDDVNPLEAIGLGSNLVDEVDSMQSEQHSNLVDGVDSMQSEQHSNHKSEEHSNKSSSY